jgi:citrate lyase subunit beta/citryl-CoA lyase
MPATIRPRRSVLFMPGSNARALGRAKTLPADALIFDLEDAVAPDAKATARQMVCDAVHAGGGGYGGRELIVRVNASATPWGAADLAVVVVDGRLIENLHVEEARRVVALAESIAALEAEAGS